MDHFINGLDSDLPPIRSVYSIRNPTLDEGIFISHPVIHSILRIQFTFCFGFFVPPLLLFSNLSHHSPPPLTKSIQPSTMAYHALDQNDSQEDTVILLGCSSTSSTVFKGVDDINDSQHQERQLATPRNLVSVADGLEWLQNYEEIARANNWSSRAKLNIVTIYLLGSSNPFECYT